MKTRLLLFVSGALALVACGQKNENATTTDVSVNDNAVLGNEVAAPAASPLTAQGFANAAAASDKFEIESSKLAASAATSAAVKSFAARMVTAHTGSTAKLKATATGLNLTPADTVAPDQPAKLDSLKALKASTLLRRSRLTRRRSMPLTVTPRRATTPSSRSSPADWCRR